MIAPRAAPGAPGRLADKAAGAPDITPAMLQAGVNVIVEEWGICGCDIAPNLARDVFKVMWMEKSSDHGTSS